MNIEEAREGIRQTDERIRQAYKRREELELQFERMPLEQWSDAVVAGCERELTAEETELMEQMELLLNRQERVKEELYGLLDEKDVLVREFCRCLLGQEEREQIHSAWEKERREWRMRIDPDDVIDLSDVLNQKEAAAVIGISDIQNRKEAASGQYTPREIEALADFARTGDLKGLISLGKREQRVNPDNPLGAMVLNRLTAEASQESRGLLGRDYLKGSTLMKKGCGSKGEELLFGAAPYLDWSEFSEQGREDYDNGNYERAARCLTLSVDKLLKKGQDVLEGRTAKKWLAEECRLLADIYLEGKGTVPASPERAATYLRTAADQALDIEAAYRLGALHAEGKSISADPELARRYMTMAANQGHVRAGADLAYAMLTGKEWAKILYSESRVLSCLDAGLKSGDKRAAFYMGILCCIQGRLGDAVTWFEKISDWEAARITLGQIYFKQENYQRAVTLLKEGCDLLGYKYCWEYTINSHVSRESDKFVRLSECMGQCYALGLGGCEKDYQKAKTYLEDAVSCKGVQAKSYDLLVFIYLLETDRTEAKMEKAVKYWMNGQRLGSSQVPLTLTNYIFALLKSSQTDGKNKGLVSQCIERLRQLADEGNAAAKYEYCSYFIHFLPYMTEGTAGKMWHYSDRNYFRGNESYGHTLKAPEMEQLLDAAIAGGIKFAPYVKGKHYLNLNKTGKAYEAFQKGADAGDSRAKNELSHFKKTLLGYSYQK